MMERKVLRVEKEIIVEIVRMIDNVDERGRDLCLLTSTPDARRIDKT